MTILGTDQCPWWPTKEFGRVPVMIDCRPCKEVTWGRDLAVEDGKVLR